MAVQRPADPLNEALRLLRSGEFARALTLTASVRAAAPWSDRAFLIHAIIRIRTQSFELAMPTLLRAIALNPGNGDTLHQLGQCALRMNQYADAETWSLRAVSVRPSWADPYFMIGSNHYALGNFTVAAEWLAKAVACRPNWAAAQFAVGRVLFLSGQRAAAGLWLAKAAALDPGFRKREEFLMATLTPDDFEAWFTEPM